MENKQITQLVKKLAKVVYPEYNGRKFSAEVKSKYYVSNYWSGGSRDYMVAIDLHTGRIMEPSHESTVPFNSIANTCIDIPPGVGILEHSYFCGKDMGIRLYVSSPLQIENTNALKQIETA
jgi:hypothetical protein